MIFKNISALSLKMTKKRIEVSEKLLQNPSETSDYTDYLRLHRLSPRSFNLCNRIFNLLIRDFYIFRLFQKSRIIIILFIIVFIFLVRQTQSIDEPIQDRPGGSNKIEYAAEGLKDPFQEEKIEIKEEPEVEIETKPLPGLQIQGIVWGGVLPQAIINNKVVKVGDTIEGVRITDINKSGVTVFFGNRQYILSTSSPVSSEGPDKKKPSRR